MSTIQNIVNEFSLPGLDRLAQSKVVRSGQEKPAEGDRVRVTASLYLPGDLETTSFCHGPQLLPQIRFGLRVRPCRESLQTGWGESIKDSEWRWKSKDFYATTWKEAFVDAQVYLENEVGKLIDALKARQAALEAAEE